MSQHRRSKRGHDFYMDVWHRSGHLATFVGRQRAQWMSQIDIDSCEYCHLCSEPVALVETKNAAALEKIGTVTTNLARRADLHAYLVEYELAEPGAECIRCESPVPVGPQDIVRFFVTAWTSLRPERREMTPAEYAEWLWRLRIPHWLNGCSNPVASRMVLWEEVAV